MMKKVRIVDCLNGFDSVCYYVYPFPTGRFYLFGDSEYIRAALFAFDLEDEKSIAGEFDASVTGMILAAVAFLDDYLLGKEHPAPALDLSGYTDRERRVYAELQKIPMGKTVSYAGLARRARIPGGARFVGNAMGKNRFPIFVPCHRVIRSDGGIGGFSAGISVKRFLLEHERVVTENRK